MLSQPDPNEILNEMSELTTITDALKDREDKLSQNNASMKELLQKSLGIANSINDSIKKKIQANETASSELIKKINDTNTKQKQKENEIKNQIAKLGDLSELTTLATDLNRSLDSLAKEVGYDPNNPNNPPTGGPTGAQTRAPSYANVANGTKTEQVKDVLGLNKRGGYTYTRKKGKRRRRGKKSRRKGSSKKKQAR
tara:strand:- start:2991 stop:3581 length:591 start_codon:yes stop_codon:yes gene_type:complete